MRIPRVRGSAASERHYVSVGYTHAPTDPRVRRHCESFARRGWRVYQIGVAAAGEGPVGRLGNIVLIRWRRPRYRGVRLLRYLGTYAAFFFWVRRVLARLNRSRRINILQINNIPNFLIWAVSSSQRRGARLVLDIHDPEPELFLSKFGDLIGARWGARLLAFVERRAARHADVVLCVHEEHRAVTRAHGVDEEKLGVVVNHADGCLFALRPPRPTVPFVAYHGTVAARMGLDVVLQGIALARSKCPGLRGAIWGDGDAVASLQALRDALGLTDIIECSGNRFRLEELLPRLDGVGLGIVTVRRDVFTDVMLPTKLLEYVRLGIPVAVSWTPTIARFVSEDAVFFLYDLSADEVARVIDEALSAPEMARERAQRAQQLAVAQSWQENEQAYVDLLCGV
jgi:glycosyltransferase involved in cell wall biosynthesis